MRPEAEILWYFVLIGEIIQTYGPCVRVAVEDLHDLSLVLF